MYNEYLINMDKILYDEASKHLFHISEKNTFPLNSMATEGEKAH